MRFRCSDFAFKQAAFCAQPASGKHDGTTRQRQPSKATQRNKSPASGKQRVQAPPAAVGVKAFQESQRKAGVTATPSRQRWKSSLVAVKAENNFKHAAKEGEKKRVRREKEKAVMSVASSRQMNRLNPKNWYFLLLEVGWLTLLLIFVATYVGAWMLNLGVGLLVADVIANPDGWSTFEVTSWTTISNLVSGGYTGNLVPETFPAFLVGTLQQLQGILLQAFLFSVAVTRFQMPEADLILSDSLVFTNRFHVPHLIFRIGNLRCNMIFHPSVSLTMLKQVRTPEGESFVSMEALDVDIPSVMGGSVTITHKVTEDSPLFECVQDGRVTPDKLGNCAFSVTIVANDDVYQAEVNAMKRYTSEDFQFNKQFDDVMKMDGRSADGKPKFRVDFDKFHDVKDLPPVSASSPGGTLGQAEAGTPALIDVKMCL